MIHLCYAAAGAESAKALLAEIEDLVGKTGVMLHKQKQGDFQHASGELCVNWGGSQVYMFSGSNWLNKRLILNKFRMLEKFNQFEVPTVKFMKTNPDVEGWYARKAEHTDGDDLEQQLTKGDFYVKHIDTEREYRVHVFKGTILRASLKVPLNAKAKLPFRTGDDWGFSNADHKANLGPAGPAAIAAVTALGYDFGGVDVAIRDNGQAVVFEVNSAPWLPVGGDAARRYAKAIVALK